MEINTRMQAAAKMLKIFWNGSPCRHGHTSGRYVSTGACVACQNAANENRMSGYSAKLKVARVLGVVDVTVQVPPGKEADAHAYAAALVMQRDADRAAHMNQLLDLTLNPKAIEERK